ncbi:MAG: hypothetical protein ABFS21_05740 [Actinomycetota bacterium]
MTVALIAAAVAVAYVMFKFSRSTKRTKKEAIADLEREREALHTPDIIELVMEEVRESGIDELPGADEIDPTVLLRVWKRDREECPAGDGRFVLVEGVDPANASADDLTFECPSG